MNITSDLANMLDSLCRNGYRIYDKNTITLTNFIIILTF